MKVWLCIIVFTSFSPIQAMQDNTLQEDSFPRIETPAKESPTGHSIYKQEYGLCLMAKGEVKEKAFEIQQIYKDKYPQIPSIYPHITLLQGRFDDNSFLEMRKHAQDIASFSKGQKIVMENSVSPGGGGNTFWNIKGLNTVESHVPTHVEWLQKLNHQLSEKLDPVLPMKQVLDGLEAGKADKDLVEKYGRDFNVPGSHHPHITVAYSVQDVGIAKNLKINTLSFTPQGITLVKIDCVGNVAKDIETFLFKS